MAIFALTLLTILVFLLTGERKFFTDNAIIYTYLDDSAALTPGAPVRLNGILIGSIRKVELSGEKKENRVIRITMEVDKEMLRSIPSDSVAAIASATASQSRAIGRSMPGFWSLIWHEQAPERKNSRSVRLSAVIPSPTNGGIARPRP